MGFTTFPCQKRTLVCPRGVARPPKSPWLVKMKPLRVKQMPRKESFLNLRIDRRWCGEDGTAVSLTGECPRSLSRWSIARAPSSESVNPCTTISPGSFGRSRDSVHTSRFAICFPSERLIAPVARSSLLRTCDRSLGRFVLPWNSAVEREWLMARPTPTRVTTPLQAAIPRKECTVPPEPTSAAPVPFFSS